MRAPFQVTAVDQVGFVVQDMDRVVEEAQTRAETGSIVPQEVKMGNKH